MELAKQPKTKKKKKEKGSRFLDTILKTLGSCILQNMLTRKLIVTAGAAIIHRIFETGSSFHVKMRNTGKFSFLFFSNLFLVSTKFLLWEED